MITPRYKHKCPGCNRLLFINTMYCNNCVALYPERQGVNLLDGQQKWLKGHKLNGIPSVDARIIVEVYGRRICLECGYDLSGGIKHKCYTKSWASGYRGETIVCVDCLERKKLGYFPVIMRRIRGNCRDDAVRLHICSACLNGKFLLDAERMEKRYEAK